MIDGDPPRFAREASWRAPGNPEIIGFAGDYDHYDLDVLYNAYHKCFDTWSFGKSDILFSPTSEKVVVATTVCGAQTLKRTDFLSRDARTHGTRQPGGRRFELL